MLVLCMLGLVTTTCISHPWLFRICLLWLHAPLLFFLQFECTERLLLSDIPLLLHSSVFWRNWKDQDRVHASFVLVGM